MRQIYLGSTKIHDINAYETLGYAINIPIGGVGLPDFRLASYDKPGEHGAIVANQLYGGRTIDMTGIVWGNTVGTFGTRRRTLESALRIIKSNFISLPITLKFTTDDGLNLQIDTYCNRFQMDEERPTVSKFLISLFGPDPNFYDQNETVTTIQAPAGGGVVIPVIFPMTLAAATGGSATALNAGSANTHPVAKFHGPLTNPVLTNVTTGEFFKINYTLVAGQTLVVDMKDKTMVLNDVSNLMAAWDSDNVWLDLVPGSNLLQLSTDLGTDTGNVEVVFRSAYAGI